MEPPPSRLRIEIAPKTIFLVLGVVAGIWLLGQLATVLSVLLVSLVLVGTCDPAVAWLQRRGFRRGLALAVVFVVAALAMTAFLLLMVPPLIAQLLQMIEGAPTAKTQLVAKLEDHGWAKPLIEAVKDLPIETLSARAGAGMLDYSTSLFELIGYGISALFLAIYMLAEPARAKGLLYAVVPRHDHVKVANILFRLGVIVGGYMRGQLITSLSIGVFVFVLLTVLGAENALAIALFAAVVDVIPFVGGYLASAPVIIAVSSLGATTVVVVTGLMVLYQEFESRILTPRVYGKVLRLSPAVVLLALLVGGTLAGMLGALLALPITAGLRMMIHELRVDLPGDAPATTETHARDERASAVYEQMSGGVSTADAGVIADDLAAMGRDIDNRV